MARTTDLTDVVVRRGSVFLGGCAAFSSLPLAAFAIIIAKLDLVSYVQLSMTCRSLYLLLQSDEVWDVLVQRDYPTSLYTLAQQVDDRLDDLLMPSPFVHYRPAVMLEPASQSSRSVYVALHCYFKNAARWFRRVCDELHQASLVLDSLGRWSCPSCLRFACRCSNAHLVYTAHGYLQWLENHTVLRQLDFGLNQQTNRTRQRRWLARSANHADSPTSRVPYGCYLQTIQPPSRTCT